MIKTHLMELPLQIINQGHFYMKKILKRKRNKNRNYYAAITDSIPHLKFETQVKDGKRNGLRRGWYHSGELKFEGYFKNGWNNGSYKNWYENGNLEKESFFEMGVKVGSCIRTGLIMVN